MKKKNDIEKNKFQGTEPLNDQLYYLFSWIIC